MKFVQLTGKCKTDIFENLKSFLLIAKTNFVLNRWFWVFFDHLSKIVHDVPLIDAAEKLITRKVM